MFCILQLTFRIRISHIHLKGIRQFIYSAVGLNYGQLVLCRRIAHIQHCAVHLRSVKYLSCSLTIDQVIYPAPCIGCSIKLNIHLSLRNINSIFSTVCGVALRSLGLFYLISAFFCKCDL